MAYDVWRDVRRSTEWVRMKSDRPQSLPSKWAWSSGWSKLYWRMKTRSETRPFLQASTVPWVKFELLSRWTRNSDTHHTRRRTAGQSREAYASRWIVLGVVSKKAKASVVLVGRAERGGPTHARTERRRDLALGGYRGTNIPSSSATGGFR